MGRSFAAAVITLTLLGLIFLPPGCAAEEPLVADEPAPADEPEPTLENATAAWYEGDGELALRRFRTLQEQSPGESEVTLSLLLLLREQGKRSEAARIAATLPPELRSEQLKTAILGGLPPGEWQDALEREAREEGDPLWIGLGRMILGETGPAVIALEEAASEIYAPYAHLFLGEIALSRGDVETAVSALEEAMEDERNLTSALLPLARGRYRLGAVETAYQLLRRAEVALPWNEEIPALRREWEERHPELLRRQGERDAEERSVAVPPTVAVERDALEGLPRLRVGLAESLRSIYIKSGGPFKLFSGREGLSLLPPRERGPIVSDILEAVPLYEGEAGEVLRVTTNDGSLSFLDEEGAELLRATGPIRLHYADPRWTTTVFDLTYGEGQFYAGREDRSYRGDIEILPLPSERFTLVNELTVEEYLYSVVPSEMPAYWPPEALKAQAVAARSYTLHNRPRFRSRGFDLLSSVASAHYRGVTGEDLRTSAAVRATRGVVLEAGAGVLDAVYSANSAGYTESSKSVWGHATDLVAVSDPLLPPLEAPRTPASLYDWLQNRPESYSGDPTYTSPSSYRWRLLVPREEIERRVREDIGTVRSLRLGGRGITGRVEAVTIVGEEGETTVHRDAIRSALGGLRSNLFMVTPLTDQDGEVTAFLFEGAGWGHGVGLCQTGTAGMAKAGYIAEEILGHYYPRNTLSQKRVDAGE